MHTGGYAEFTAREDFDEVGARPATPAQVVAAAVRQPLVFTPGTKRQYSNTGYMLLQMVIERICAGNATRDFVRSHIFAPLGMTSTFARVGDDTSADVATEYESFALGPWEHALHIDYTWFGGAGAIISNPDDLAQVERCARRRKAAVGALAARDDDPGEGRREFPGLRLRNPESPSCPTAIA